MYRPYAKEDTCSKEERNTGSLEKITSTYSKEYIYPREYISGTKLGHYIGLSITTYATVTACELSSLKNS